MNIQAEKLELMALLLKTENENVLKKVKSIFERAFKENKLSFNWEGGLKELKNEFDGVKLQHHINSLRK